MHVGVGRVKKAKVHTLKSEFEIIRVKDSESVDAIVSNICSLGDEVEEIFVVQKFLRAVPLRFM